MNANSKTNNTTLKEVIITLLLCFCFAKSVLHKIPMLVWLYKSSNNLTQIITYYSEKNNKQTPWCLFVFRIHTCLSHIPRGHRTKNNSTKHRNIRCNTENGLNKTHWPRIKFIHTFVIKVTYNYVYVDINKIIILCFMFHE